VSQVLPVYCIYFDEVYREEEEYVAVSAAGSIAVVRGEHLRRAKDAAEEVRVVASRVATPSRVTSLDTRRRRGGVSALGVRRRTPTSCRWARTPRFSSAPTRKCWRRPVRRVLCQRVRVCVVAVKCVPPLPCSVRR
jgi:hypothetical protein